MIDEPNKRILWAAEHGNLEAVNEIMATAPEMVHSHDNDHYTPLHRAAYNNHVEVAKVCSFIIMENTIILLCTVVNIRNSMAGRCLGVVFLSIFFHYLCSLTSYNFAP